MGMMDMLFVMGFDEEEWLLNSMNNDGRMRYMRIPSGKRIHSHIAIENGPVEIVDLPITVIMVIFHSFL